MGKHASSHARRMEARAERTGFLVLPRRPQLVGLTVALSASGFWPGGIVQTKIGPSSSSTATAGWGAGYSGKYARSKTIHDSTVPRPLIRVHS